MGTSFQYGKTLAAEGSLLLLLGLVPYVGWVLGIIGVVLLLKGLKELSNYYQDNEIYENSLTGVKYYIVALIAAAAAIVAITLGVWTATGFTFQQNFVMTAGFAASLIAFFAALVIAFIFYILAASHLRRTFNALAQKSGEHSFETAGILLWVGALLTIVFVGLLLIFVAWIFAVVSFFSMKAPQQQQPYGYAPTATAPPTTTPPTQASRFCSNCGAPASPQATFCSHCGKQLQPQ